MKSLLSALLLIPCIASAQVNQLKNFIISPPYDGSRNSVLVFEFMARMCEGYSRLTKDISVVRTSSGFELTFNALGRIPDCFGNRLVENRMAVAPPFVLPDTPLTKALTLSVKLGDGRTGSISVEAARFPRVRTVPVALDFTWVESQREQIIKAGISEPTGRLEIYPNLSRNRRGYCLCSKQECFRILVCARSTDVGLGEPDFGNNSGSSGRGAKRHLIFIQSPSSLSIWNDDGTTFSASPCTDLSGRWQIVDPMAALKYGLTAISMERASNVSSIFDLTEDLLVSATAGEGALFCLPTGDCRLNLTASTRGNRSVQLHFPRAGITNDRVYRFAPFPDASANDLALGRYAGFGTRTLVMVRE